MEEVDCCEDEGRVQMLPAMDQNLIPVILTGEAKDLQPRV